MNDSEVLLTPRWWPIPERARNHREQIRLKADIATQAFRNFVIAAGRRSFKTERFLKRDFVRYASTIPDQVTHLGAPTRVQAKEIFWDDVKKLSPKYLVSDISESELRIKYNIGAFSSVLHVVGLKEFQRQQGGRSHRVGITEFQECDPGVYSQTFEPMLNDTRGTAIVEGRPLGKNHLYDFHLRGVNHLAGWGSYHWKSSEILSAEQIEEARTNQSLPDYLREYDASFETDAGAPYHSYSELNNKKHQYVNTLPLIITCDFNATEKPMSWVIGQRVNEAGRDVTYWIKTFSHQYTHTKAMCEIVHKWLTDNQYQSGLNFYGDYAGTRHESNSSSSDWQIIEGHFRNMGFTKHLKQCRSIRNTVAATNGQLLNANGLRRQFVDPEECKPLVADWQKCIWKENGWELNEEDKLRGHACRAVDYYNDFEYPVVAPPTMKAI